MADFSSLKVAELKAELDQREIPYPKSAKKQDLLDLLVERTKETVTTAGFEPATTTTAEPASASAPPTLADESKPAPTTATDALSSTTNAASEPLPAETTAEPTKGAADGAAPNRAPAPPADAPPPPPPAPPAVPESTITASFPYPAEDLTDAVVDEVPTGVEQSADGDDERRGGDAVLGTDEEEIILGTLPADEKTDAPEDVEMAAPAPVEPAPAPAEPESQGAADAAMNDAAASVPVAAAPAAAPAAVPTPPPPTPAPKRSLSPSADAEMRSSAAEPAAKRVKAEPADLPLPANFVAGAHPPTAALYITNLRRPLPDNALIDLLENFGKLDADAGVGKGAGKEGSTTDKEGWWLSPVKSHAFAAFTTPEAAREAYESLLGRTDFPPEAPQPTPALGVAFLPAHEIPRLIAQEEAGWASGRQKLELRIARAGGEGDGSWTYSYENAGDVDLRRQAASRPPPAGFGANGGSFGREYRGPPSAPRDGGGGFQGGFGGGPRGGGGGGRGGFMDRGNYGARAPPPHANGRDERPDFLTGRGGYSSAPRSSAATSSSAGWGDSGRPPPFRARDDDGDDRRGGGGRGGWGAPRGGADSFRPADSFRAADTYLAADSRRGPDVYRRADSFRSADSYQPATGGGGGGASGGWSDRGRDRRRSPSPQPRWKSPAGRRGRSRSPSRGRNDGW